MTLEDGSERRDVLYMTIDPCDHRDAAGNLRGHGPNLARLREAAASWRSDTVVRDLWCGHVTAETLADPRVLAQFLSGSYTDWVEAFRQPDWKCLLDEFCAESPRINREQEKKSWRRPG